MAFRPTPEQKRKALLWLSVAAGVVGLAFAPWHLPIPASPLLAAGMVTFMLLPLAARERLEPRRRDGGTKYLTGRTRDDVLDAVARVLGTVAWGSLAFLNPFNDGHVMGGWLAVIIGSLAAVVSLLGMPDPYGAPAILLESSTLSIENHTEGNHILAYAELKTVEVAGGILTLATAKDRYEIPVIGPQGRAAEIRSAILEAKEASARRENPDAPVNRGLKRPPGMEASEWLRRIDALAATTQGSGAYRGEGFEDGELWTTLADEGADADTRIAAARVLAAGGDAEVRTRVATSVDTIGDENLRARVRVALVEDPEVAAAEMEALELGEFRKRTGSA